MNYNQIKTIALLFSLLYSLSYAQKENSKSEVGPVKSFKEYLTIHFESYKTDRREQLGKLGFRYSGKEILYHGISGQRMPVKIYIGNMYYLKLKYMVANLLHARASGKIALLTRQPIEGRARGGA